MFARLISSGGFIILEKNCVSGSVPAEGCRCLTGTAPIPASGDCRTGFAVSDW
ncbi:MAG: hypothetical protein HXS54_09950 [Theionarchaea archaeon]|nr:hypothetical protein [Theionarchaea archaeon]